MRAPMGIRGVAVAALIAFTVVVGGCSGSADGGRGSVTSGGSRPTAARSNRTGLLGSDSAGPTLRQAAPDPRLARLCTHTLAPVIEPLVPAHDQLEDAPPSIAAGFQIGDCHVVQRSDTNAPFLRELAVEVDLFAAADGLAQPGMRCQDTLSTERSHQSAGEINRVADLGPGAFSGVTSGEGGRVAVEVAACDGGSFVALRFSSTPRAGNHRAPDATAMRNATIAAVKSAIERLS